MKKYQKYLKLAKKYFQTASRVKIATLATLVLILITLPMVVFVGGTQQSLRFFAAGTGTCDIVSGQITTVNCASGYVCPYFDQSNSHNQNATVDCVPPLTLGSLCNPGFNQCGAFPSDDGTQNYNMSCRNQRDGQPWDQHCVVYRGANNSCNFPQYKLCASGTQCYNSSGQPTTSGPGTCLASAPTATPTFTPTPTTPSSLCNAPSIQWNSGGSQQGPGSKQYQVTITNNCTVTTNMKVTIDPRTAGQLDTSPETTTKSLASGASFQLPFTVTDNSQTQQGQNVFIIAAIPEAEPPHDNAIQGFYYLGPISPSPTPTGGGGTCDTKVPGQQCTNIWTDKDTYAVGENVGVCFSLPGTDHLKITATKPDGTDIPELDTSTSSNCGNMDDGTTVPGDWKVTLTTDHNGTATATYTVSDSGGTGGPTATSEPTATEGGPTGTEGGPTATSEPSETPGGPTDTEGPSETPGGPTDTPGGPTETPGGPTDTPGGPTDTPGQGPDTKVAVSVKLQAIDATGGPALKINNAPQNPTRDLIIFVYDKNADTKTDEPVGVGFGKVTYNASTGIYSNTNFDLGQDLTQSGQYKVVVQVDGHLRKQLPGLPTITIGAQTGTQNTLNTTPPVLIAGDLDNNDVINLLDYNILIGCFPNSASQNNFCDPQLATLNDRAEPQNQKDQLLYWNDQLSILLTNFSIQSGD